MAISLDELIQPIPGDHPGGTDVSFEQIFEDIKEARRQDDPTLSQGEWKAELKTADWRKSRDLCVEVLTNQSKDLQAAAWLTEALGQVEGFSGYATGFQLVEKLLADFWETLFPEAEGGDNELRIGKIAWMEKNLPLQVRFLPLTQESGYGWYKWKESRDVDNLARSNSEAAAAAVTDGKITGETWDQAVIATPAGFYQERYDELTALKAAMAAMEARVDERFGSDAPSLKELRTAVDDCLKLVTRIATDKGLIGGAAESEAPTEGDGETAQGDDAGLVAPAARGGGPAGPIASRAEALRRLAEVAAYFRKAEPHSPVAYLVDRAVRWGNMTLEQWLAENVKDETMLGKLRETLGINPEAPQE